jgi:hypothetical protein
MPPTTPIRASYAIRPARRMRARHIAAAMLIPPAAALSLGITAAIWEGTTQAMRPSPTPASAPPAHITPASHAPATLPPCPTEDSTSPRPCLWDASTRGDHRGKSFVILKNGMLIYLDGSNLPPIDPAS